MFNRLPLLERVCATAICLAIPITLTGCGTKTQAVTNRGLLFRSSGNPLQYVNAVDTIDGVAGFMGTGTPELSPGALPSDWGVYVIPTHSGVNVIRFAGNASGADPHCAMKAYTVDIPIDDSTKLSYWIYPQQDNARYVGVDLHCTDGATLSTTAAVDQNGASMNPSSGHGDGVAPRTWSQIECEVGKWLSGKTVDKIDITYHHPGGGGQYRGYIDDIILTDGDILSRGQIVSSPARTEPDWVKDAVIYGVDVKRFSPAGNFNGVTAQLDRIHSLGATVIWLLPINPIGREKAFGSPYCVRDYYGINPDLGSASDLHRLVDAAHKRGMKVILDLALDHTSWDNDLIQKHPEWYRHDGPDKTNPATVSRTPMWSDVAQLDYTNRDLWKYMIDMESYWIKTFDVDGFRYDSAELMPTEFFDQSTAAVKALKPNTLLLAEGHRPETMMHDFDVDYSFTLYPQIVSVTQGKEGADSIGQVLQYERYQFPKGTLHMRYSGNQDTEKPDIQFGPQGARAVALMAFTLDGIPLIYNGMEIGDAVPGNIITAPKIDWSKGDTKDAAFFAKLSALRRSFPELRDGTLQWLGASQPQRVAAYARGNGRETAVVVVNLSATSVKTTLGLKKGVTLSDVTPAFSNAGVAPAPVNSTQPVDLGPYGYRILACKAPMDQVVQSHP